MLENKLFMQADLVAMCIKHKMAVILTFHILLQILLVASWICVLTLDFSYLYLLWKLHYILWENQTEKDDVNAVSVVVEVTKHDLQQTLVLKYYN